MFMFPSLSQLNTEWLQFNWNPHCRHIEECHKTSPDVAQDNQDSIEVPGSPDKRLETVIYFLTEEGEEAMLVTEEIGVEEEVIDGSAATAADWVPKRLWCDQWLDILKTRNEWTD